MTTPLARPTRLDRWAGGCLVASAVLILPGTVHPDIFETTLAHAALHSDLWVTMHVAALVVAMLSLFGFSAIYLPRADRLGRLGGVGFGLLVPGLVMAAAVSWAEAVLLPPLAREQPELFDWDGPVTTAWGVVGTAGLAVLWWIGLVLLGVAFWRAGTVPAPAALTLAGGALLAIVLVTSFVPLGVLLATVVLAVGHAGVGASSWAGATAPPRLRFRDYRRSQRTERLRHG